MIGVFAAKKRMPRHYKRSSHSCCSKQKFKGGHPPFFVRESLSDYLGKSCDKRAHNKWYKAKIEVRNLARSNVAKEASSANRNFAKMLTSDNWGPRRSTPY